MPKKQNTDLLEKDIEKKVCDHAKSLGCLVYKFTSPSKRSVPDRLFIMPEGKGVFFIEFKRKGVKPTPAQEVEINKIINMGIPVYVVDDVARGKSVVAGEMQRRSQHAPLTLDPLPTIKPAGYKVTPAMRQRSNVSESVLLARYKLDLQNHDWHYARSDDPRAYGKGSKEEERLHEIAKTHGDEFVCAFYAARLRAFPMQDPMF